MEKILNLNKTVAVLVGEYPELLNIMSDLGFKEITSPMALEMMGSVMTIPKGAAIKGIDLGHIVDRFRKEGFTVTGVELSGEKEVKKIKPLTDIDTSTPEGRRDLLKNYIARLSNGEDLEKVRKEFVDNFESVSVHEIAAAEQGLIGDGMPVEEVQKLCDIHSALFHGMTEDEVMEKEKLQMAEAAAHKAAEAVGEIDFDKLSQGHPLSIMHLENIELEKFLNTVQPQVSVEIEPATMTAWLTYLKDIKKHYAKKEELLMPILYNVGITGPSMVMWGVDDEIFKEIRVLIKTMGHEEYSSVVERASAVLQRMREMIYKEEKILFPLSKENLNEKDWLNAYRDLEEIGFAFITDIPEWDEGERYIAEEKARYKAETDLDYVVKLPTGEITVRQLALMVEILPVDITFIDENERFTFFVNEGRVFARPTSALGREVYGCHPPQVIPIVKEMIGDFKNKRKRNVERWIPNPEDPVRVQYFGVYDDEDRYIGTVEIVQSFKDIIPSFKQIMHGGMPGVPGGRPHGH